MIAGLSGTLLSHDALEQLLSGAMSGAPLDHPGSRGERLRSWYANVSSRLGPTAGARTVFDLVADPLVRALGFEAVPLARGAGPIEALLQQGGVPVAALVVTPWGQPLPMVWRQAVHIGLAHGSRWAFCINGPQMRIVDVERTYARRFAEFDLGTALEDIGALRVFCAACSAAGSSSPPGFAALEAMVAASERHRAGVRGALREGVHEALLRFVAAFRSASRRQHHSRLLHESLIVVYRIVFLLFAESRALVPNWHPVYREGYTIEAVSADLERDRAPTGIWESLQAIARLAHRGCRAGSLRVPPFNGRLFSPVDAPLAESLPLDDEVVSGAVRALTTRLGGRGRERISYADLGVEQLGAVYEHLLDYDLAASGGGGPAMLVASGRRKATGSFYTPRSLTEFVVRRTLAPVVKDKSSGEILALRVLDPAMGSGAFLVAACRFLAAAYERALLTEGVLALHDVTPEDRAAFRRLVAQHCLFGVDINPMAVQLGRLSMWLATLSATKPLSFLDHHLRVGNSLVGGSIEDIRRQPSPGRECSSARELPLFEEDALKASLESAVGLRLEIARTPDDTVEQVRGKERTLARMAAPGGTLERWKKAADLWCSAWWTEGARAGRGGTFAALVDSVVHGRSALPGHTVAPILVEANATAASERFFHWTLEFPEVFYGPRGDPRPDPGFDAVVGNPPWEMLRREGARAGTRELRAFVRGSGIYRRIGDGHTNLYQLFVERALQLLRPGGRAGLILPWGFGTDRSSAPLRRTIFETATVDTFTSLDNRDRIFPIHRSVKFLLLTLANGGSTAALPARWNVRSPELLDRVPDTGHDTVAGTIPLPLALIARVSGESLEVPEIRTSVDLTIVSKTTFEIPAAGSVEGWGLRFGRELNATDDRPSFSTSGTGLPVIEGKQIHPFRLDVEASRHRIAAGAARKLLDPERTFNRARLAYREVASSTNRTTLIATVVPAGVVTTHTVFCLKDALDAEAQDFLCAVFNSYVANYLVRMRVGTHVTASIIARLPVPKPPRSDRVFRLIARLGRSLARRFEPAGFARVNALVALLYRLTRDEFAHVLGTFPLVPPAEREEALRLFVPERV